jgi:adenylate cyclase
MLAEGMVLHGWAVAMQGDVEQGIAELRQGMTNYQVLGVVALQAYNLNLLAQVHAKAGQFEAGLTTIEEALAAVYISGDRCVEAEIHRLTGQLSLAVGRTADEAELAFQQALQVARQQKARSLELRAAVSLSRLWQQQGRIAEAQQLLAEIYHWFTEGFDTADLQEAKALLDELQAAASST